jgi:membrane peptidoglycan carboxypeptidase
MAQRKTVSKGASFFMFLAVSVVVALLAAAMTVPFVGMSAASAKAVATTLEDLPQSLTTPPQITGSKVLLSDGTEIATFAAQNREYVTLDQIAPVMQYAQVAIEDHRFFEHGAVDARGIIRAFLGNSIGAASSGASTLTQQYVKQVRLQIAIQAGDSEAQKEATAKSYSRKIIEMRYAMSLEKELTKDQILERYLNIAYYGDGAYGVQAAAMHYFGINASQLDLAQAAMLAGLVQNPSATDPVNHELAALSRRNTVLDRMNTPDVKAAAESHFNVSFTDADIQAAKDSGFDSTKVVKFTNGCTSSSYPFICDYVQRTIESDAMSNLGSTGPERLANFEAGGYTVNLTIDKSIQDDAQSELSSKLDYRDGAMIATAVVQPSTGKIKAMAQTKNVYGLDAAASQTMYNYAVDNDMGGAEGFQFGSNFKAFTLAAALQQGVSFNKTYNAVSPLDLSKFKWQDCAGDRIVPGTDWSLKNDNGRSAGNIPLSTALRNSVNTYFLQLENAVGLCNVVKTAQALGVHSAMAGKNGSTDLITGANADQIPSFTLGSVEVSPLTMAEAYATFGNRGIYCTPTIIDSMTDAKNESITVPSGNCQQVMSAEVADGVNQGLTYPLSGTAASARLGGGYAQAGKTGTANDNALGAFTGYTPDLSASVAIAWDKTSPQYVAGQRNLQGYHSAYSQLPYQGISAQAAGIWKGFMQNALKGTPKTQFNPYKPITGALSEASTPAPNSSPATPYSNEPNSASPEDESTPR